MAKFTINRWRCDRCGVEADSWLKPGSAHSIIASVDYGVAGGQLLEWRELCVDCNHVVEKAIEGLKSDAAAIRAKKDGWE